MRNVAKFLVVFIIARSLCGRGPALFGLSLAFAIPAGLLLVLIGVLYPEGPAGFTESALRVIIRGFH